MHKAIELLESVVDLHLGNIDMDGWLQSLADQTDSAAAYAASWPAQRPASAEINFSNKLFVLDSKWLPSIDRVISIAEPDTPGLLDEIARAAGLQDKSPDNPLNDPAWMIAFLDSYPACTILALRCSDERGSWRESDRDLFKQVLPVLLKAHLLHKHIVLAANRLTIASKILDSTPRGLISMTPTGEILRKNTMAQDLLKSGDAVLEKKGHLICRDDKVMLQFKEKLAQVRALPSDSLEQFVWNRSFQNIDATQNYQLSMKTYPLENWRLESSPHDRFVIVNLNTTSFKTLPTAEQLSDFYDLTSAQSRLVIALLKGKNAEEAAEHLNVSVNTIRSHLRAVYGKLGTDSRAGLIRIVSATLVGYSGTPS